MATNPIKLVRPAVPEPATSAMNRACMHKRIRDVLVTRILDGTYPPEFRFKELTLAREFDVSQGPVREALRELEMLGFVRSEPHRGTYVRNPWQRGMLELYELRGALEEFAARMATAKLSEDTSALQAEVDAMAAAAVADDVHATVEHSERFHRLIIEASGNQLLETVWSSLSITDHTALTMVTLSPDLSTIAQSHQPIVDAIASGDIELACRVSREHQAWFEELLAATAEQGAQRTSAVSA